MNQYHKIDSLFERDMQGTRKLIEGKFRNPVVEYIKDNEWIFTEKIDGTNIRVFWDGHKVSFGGRTDNAQIPANLVQVLQDKFMGNEAEELFEQKFGEDEVTFYGEGFGEKIQKGGGLYGAVDFILFDIQVGDIYLQREDIEELAKTFSLRIVPIILEGTIEEAVALVKSGLRSSVAEQEKIAEGLVGTPKVRLLDVRGKRVIVKIKTEDFVLQN